MYDIPFLLYPFSLLSHDCLIKNKVVKFYSKNDNTV